jgi:hypothetical protein
VANSQQNISRPWWTVLRSTRKILLTITPLASSFVQLMYFSFLHEMFLFSDFHFSIWMLVLLAPPILFEIWFTRFFEVERFGWKTIVKLGFASRLTFIVCCFYFCVWYTLLFNNTPDPVLGLFRRWPDATWLFWAASPKLAVILGSVLAVVYLVFTCKYRLFRLQTTIILPAAATLLLANLLYFHPTSPYRLENGQRPEYVQQVFPSSEFSDSEQIFKVPLYAREVFVGPSDDFAVLTFGPSFGSERLNQPNFVWLDLENKSFEHKSMDQTRNFYSECPDTIYIAPWHDSSFYEFDPVSRTLLKFVLPESVAGFRVLEIMYIYHACDSSTVYLVNTRNPVLFAWDSQSKTLKHTIPLARLGLQNIGDQIAAIGRNRISKRIYLISVGRYELTEFDEKTLKPLRSVHLPHDPFDIQVSRDGRYLYIAAFLKKVIWKLEAESMAIVNTFDAPRHCRRIALSPNEDLLFAGSYVSGEVAVINAQTGARLLDFYVSPKLEGMYVTKRYLYLLGAEGLFKVDLNKFKNIISLK